jgi:flagellar M-ring protein FliF
MAEEQNTVPALTTGVGQDALVAPEPITLFAQLWPEGVNAPSTRQMGLGLAVVAALAALVVGIMWMDTSTYRVVYPGLSDRDAAAIVGALEASGVPVRIHPSSGNVEVPSDRVHEARFKLAADGLPRGNGAGFEFLQEAAPMGSSQFMDVARYRHAMETELARSVASLSSVERARVHLAMERRSAFVRDQVAPTASVVLKLYSGRGLDEGQVAAIAHLVSTAVPGMKADGVSIIDQLGRLLSSTNAEGANQLSLDQLEYTRRVERNYVRRIEQILSPLVGVGSVKAEASADIDFTVVERTEEKFDNGDTPQVRSEQVTRELKDIVEAQGVPGALTNEPATTPSELKPETQPTEPAKDATRWVRNFELDKSVSHVQIPIGQVKRLSVAVVVDHATVTAADGTVARQALAPEQVERITQLVKDAVGFNEQRGDSVNVVNSAFHEDTADVVPIWEEAWFLALGKLGVITFLVLLVLFLVVRPLLKAFVTTSQAAANEAAIAAIEQHASPTQSAQPVSSSRRPANEAANIDLGQHASFTGDLLHHLTSAPDYKADIKLVQRIAASDPRRAAQVIKRWLEDGR